MTFLEQLHRLMFSTRSFMPASTYLSTAIGLHSYWRCILPFFNKILILGHCETDVLW